MTAYSVVIPTVGRPALQAVLAGLAAGDGPLPEQVVIVDDRRDRSAALAVEVPAALAGRTRVVCGSAGGPAAARNCGWRETNSPWVAFLDDDVRPPAGWRAALAADLAGCGAHVGGSQGRVVVPSPARRPTDAERQTAGLASAAWATADMAYRRAALEAVHGFDERFPRAYREDADLALRVRAAGYDLVRGERHVVHPPHDRDRWASLRAQRGNADDALLRRLHGADWRQRAGAPRGGRRGHLATTALLGLAASVGLVPRRRPLALLAAAAWLARTGAFAARRIAPGPRDRSEIATMLLTSAAIPPLASWHWVRGLVAHRRSAAWPPPRAVLFDRDGTLVHDVPYNGDPELVRPVDGAVRSVKALRRRGFSLAVVTNQSGVGSGRITAAQVESVNARVDAMIGPFDGWYVCPHAADAGCACRKPAATLVREAAAGLGVHPAECVLIGDTGGDVGAATAAGARSVLVPTPVTRREEVLAAPLVAARLPDAVRLVLRGRA